MFDKIPKPSKTSFIFLDTNVLIDYLTGGLPLPGFSGLLEREVREFVNQFISRGILLRVTPTVKTQAKNWRDIMARKAVREGLPPYLFAKIEAIARKRYEKLLDKLFEEDSLTSNFEDVRGFYLKHKDKPALIECRKKKQVLSPIPEESDLKILAEASNQAGSYLLTADCDFYSVDEEIYEKFRVYVLSQENMNKVMRDWNWC